MKRTLPVGLVIVPKQALIPRSHIHEVVMEIANHLIYLLLSIGFTVLVGQSLYANGRPFLEECCGNIETAGAVNRFFLVGFYLLNSAFIFAILKYGETASTVEHSLEVIAGRVGFVALVMGAMHFNNLYWCEFVRRKRAVLVRDGAANGCPNEL